MKIPVGVQLYSIRDYVSKDMVGTLKKVKEAGYDCVEFAGYEGYSASELKKILDDIGLVPLSSHVGIDELCNNTQAVLDYSLELGLTNVVCPWADVTSLGKINQLSGKLNSVARVFQSQGINVGYHNHGDEFKTIDGKYAFDILLEETKDTNIFAQVDTYWAAYQGVDPLEYIKSIGNRVGLYHFKEICSSDKDKGVTVGDGDIDFAGIVRFIFQTGFGSEGIIVEQESFEGDPFVSLMNSCNYINSLLKEGI